MARRYSGGYGEFPAYIPVAKRKAKGAKAVDKIAKKVGRAAEPVTIVGRQITSTFWGKAWCDNLERYSDYLNRLPRGRAYVRNGSVLDLQISAGCIEAYVAGSELYTVRVAITALAPARWSKVIASCSNRISSLIGLLRGELAHDVLAVITGSETGLFPAPREIELRCSCPDGAYMCKHVAATLYGVGARLDHRPELFFLLRQVNQADLIGSALNSDVLKGTRNPDAPNSKRRIAPSAVASVFGIELDEEPAPAPAQPPARSATKAARKTAERPVTRAKAGAPRKVARTVTRKKP